MDIGPKQLRMSLRNLGPKGALKELKARGPSGTVRLAGNLTLTFAKRGRRVWNEWRFDRTHGIDTRGAVYKVGDEHSYQYAPLVRFDDFNAAMESVERESRERVFIDVGCGRG